MNNWTYLISFLFLFNSCGIETVTLKEGTEKVALNPKVYSNKSKFEKTLLKDIDTLVIYEEYNTSFYEGNKPLNALARNNYKNPRTSYQVYRFYNNGCFNLFILDRNDVLLTDKMFDPNFGGWRGVYYKDKNEIKGDLITQVSGMGTIGTITEKFEFRGDTLFVSAKNRWNYIYIKRKIPNELLKSNANW